jgi:hypothetical protein
LIFEVTRGLILLFPSKIHNRHSTIVNSNRWSPFQYLCLDPAVVSAPSLASIVDVSGMIIYFGTAAAILGL